MNHILCSFQSDYHVRLCAGSSDPGYLTGGYPWATTDSFPLALSFFVRVSCSRSHSKALPCLWNHGAESNCHCIFSAACGSLTAAHLLALQCRTAIARPWYKCGAIFIQPLRVILFARRRRQWLNCAHLISPDTPTSCGGANTDSAGRT